MFRTAHIYETCTIVTPQGAELVMSPGVPTQFTVDGDSDRPGNVWNYNWFGFNETFRQVRGCIDR